ncbi:MAG: caspase family protein [Nostoc sp.]|uniref:caspase, EACC1-associated type n=1 Tax=Nostoc sp. TaxID=1180 RepID=UPI002FF48146
MPKKVALLIGVSEYEAGLPLVPTADKDVKAMQRVLQNPLLGSFDQVEALVNPDLMTMQIAIQKLFADCKKDDLTFLFFSGHGITDDHDGRLYLATRSTRKDAFHSTAVPANFVQDIMKRSPSRQQVVILDCCYSGAFAVDWQAKSTCEGCALLASSTAARQSFEAEEAGIYTHYIVEGIETGAADRDKNGLISIDELHEYAKEKVQAIRPTMKPEIQTFKEGYKIAIAKAPNTKKSFRIPIVKTPTNKTQVWRCIYTLTDHSDTVNSVAISPDGQILASGSADKTIKIWNLKTGTLLETLEGHSHTVNSVVISPNGQILASGSADKTIKIWNLNTRKLVRNLGNWFSTAHSDSVYSLGITPDSQTLISGSRDHTIKLWNLTTGKEIGKLPEDSWAASSLAITPNGQAIASDSLDRTIKLFSLDTKELLQTFVGNSNLVWAIAISPDGKTLACGSQEHTVKLWNLNTGKLLHTLTDHSKPIHSITFSLNGQILASGSYDNTIKLWNVENWELICTLSGHSDGVNFVAFSSDCMTLASGSDDKTVKIWQLC